MIVRFLSKSGSFKGVSYNTRKVDKNKGELMKVSGFGPLQGMMGLRPKDYINYLKAVSSVNKRVKLPQLHIAISAKGRSHGKEELTLIAENWLKEMGYGEQPYLIIFHKDTANNHVHVVSTRVGKDGKKISSAYERVRGMTAIHTVLSQDEKELARLDLDSALGYRFSTKPQFMLLLEAKGYQVKESGGKLQVIKFGKVLLETESNRVSEKIKAYQVDEERQKQLTAIFHDYAERYSTMLSQESVSLPGGLGKLKGGYSSGFANALKNRFGVELIFHGSVGMPAYGYTIVDHSKKQVYKGSEVMDIKLLFAIEPKLPQIDPPVVEVTSSPAVVQYYSLLPDSPKLSILENPQEIDDFHAFKYADKQYDKMPFSQSNFDPDSEGQHHNNNPEIDISIADDIDDEAIHGRNRHRKRQARTNTR